MKNSVSIKEAPGPSEQKTKERGFSVIMPTYNQAAFIRRAVLSLKKQTYTQWELIIINDGSDDNTDEIIEDIIRESRVKYIKNPINQGLGYAINRGLDIAEYDYIAYLPSDDFYYENHLECLKTKFTESDEVVLVFNGLKHSDKNSLEMAVKDGFTTHIQTGYPLQLVQAGHKKTAHRWLERSEWVTEDLYLMFWNQLIDNGRFVSTGIVTCNWTNHPHQHHKLAGEKYGGCLNAYRSFYKVKNPLKMRLSKYKFVDEEKLYAPFRKTAVMKKTGLKILLAGELSYNPDRIYALEEYGHTLYGLWINNPKYSFSNVGPLPFGTIEDISSANDWQKEIKKLNPDIIYALSSWDGVELAYDVLKAKLGIPLVWHFKEGPYLCIKQGLWNKLFELYNFSDGRIFLNESIKLWYEQFLPSRQFSLIMDLDAPKKEYFQNNYSAKQSSFDGEIHTVVTGRMIGIDKKDIQFLADKHVHVHLYSENNHEMYTNLRLRSSADYFHVHQHVSSEKWTEEFSKYDAGWLHCFDSSNGGNLLKTTWDDLNIPARLYTLMAAGIPSIQKENEGHIVAMYDIVRKENTGVFYKNLDELVSKLQNREYLDHLNKNIQRVRQKYTFDYHVPELTDFFYKVIHNKIKP
jgi:glycosyltransferase involved in cell wall biosynthesis